MLTMSNALFMSSATVIVCYGSLFWLKPVAMVLLTSRQIHDRLLTHVRNASR